MPIALMVQGTTSDAGKSILVAGICRALYRRGYSVAPFKPQNMSLNSAVTADGGEIGRAQALQAQAAGMAPHSDMNPVLLKPHSDTGAQVIVQGKLVSALEAEQFHDYKQAAMQFVLQSWERLHQQYDAIIVEGAGSPAEINLRAGDIANMGFAEAVECPVIIIADIDRGGVFAHLVGTLALLSESERDLVKGFVINRFRGDIKLLEPGLRWLEQYTEKPVLGVLPYLHNLQLDAEDAVDCQQANDAANFTIVVPVLSRLSNHTDFDSLRALDKVALVFAPPGKPLPAADLVIIPGSKNVRADLEFLKAQGWHKDLARHLRYGGKIMGICGGMQMLGDTIDDPNGVEGKSGSSTGLGWLPMTTKLESQKQLHNVKGKLHWNNADASGYEIHCGVSDYKSNTTAFCTLDDGRRDGIISPDNQIAGTYLHGVFDTAAASHAILCWAGLESTKTTDRNTLREQELNRLADMVETHLDLSSLLPLEAIS